MPRRKINIEEIRKLWWVEKENKFFGLIKDKTKIEAMALIVKYYEITSTRLRLYPLSQRKYG